MKSKIITASLLLALTGCVSTKGTIVGPTKGLNKTLVVRLSAMSAHFGRTIHITSHGGCRRHPSLKGSYHATYKGCKAADMYVKGVSGRRILKYWKSHGGGGRGTYCGKRFVHVDVGPSRTWAWYCRNK